MKTDTIMESLNEDLSFAGVVAILEEIDTALPPPTEIEKRASEEVQSYCTSLKTQLIRSTVALKVALKLLNPELKNLALEDHLSLVIEEVGKRAQMAKKHSDATKTSNISRATPLSKTARAALYASFLELYELDGKMPGWKKVSDKSKQILRRDPALKMEMDLITKARVERWIKEFKKLSELGLLHDSATVATLYNLPKKTL
jgi:hypothetical protein